MDIRIDEKKYEIDRYPDTCPLCHHGIETKPIGNNFVQTRNALKKDSIEIFFRCPRLDCQKSFIGYYSQNWGNHGYAKGIFLLRSVAPYEPKTPELFEGVEEISPSFKEIYIQSYTAEHFNLHQVAGVGYRKALEFLIKDFLIYEQSEKESQIKEQPLGACINNFIADTNIKSCAKRATWLGNDETHYTRKWIEQDLSDLKVLIELTLNWIRTKILTDKYIGDMPESTNTNDG